MSSSPNEEHKILIANRGEIAVRIIRACRDMQIASIAVYADPDSRALHVSMADEAWALSGKHPLDTYLNIPALLDIARRSGATMVHPGYGFLSERADFARAVKEAGLIWIGPLPETIEKLGDKVQARKIAQRVGAPLLKGSADPVEGVQQVLDFAHQQGLPIAIKAAFGGGGRGLKVARTFDEVAECYWSATREAHAAFGRAECFVEQYIDKPRHIEAQILADTHGQMVVLGTRDCSLQRRNQKLVEEAPAPFISDTLRQQIHQSALDICRHVGYIGAGTVEFLLSQDNQLSFLEVNTRLQVEHPVTEQTTGIDIVEEQIRIAQGLALSIKETPRVQGHAFEFRINAEDVGRGFLPTPGRIQHFAPPSGPGIRVDSGVESGSTVPAEYDSLMAKLIVSGSTREQALQRARRALREFSVDGIASVLDFHRAVVEQPDFIRDFSVYTQWIETDFACAIPPAKRVLPDRQAPLYRTWIELDGRRVNLGIPEDLLVRHQQDSPDFLPLKAPPEHNPEMIVAPLSGVLLHWSVVSGSSVEQGQVVAVMESMKMEVEIVAPHQGKITDLSPVGQLYSSGIKIASLIDE